MGGRSRRGWRRGLLTAGLGATLWVAAGCRFVEGRLESVAPAEGLPGQAIEILGQGFGTTPAGRWLHYGGERLEILAWSDGRIEAVLPRTMAAGRYEIEFRTAAGPWPARLDHTLLADTFRSPPVVEGLRVRARAANPLSATVTFRTDLPATPLVAVEGPDGTRLVPPAGVRSSVPGLTHEAVVLGLRPGTAYTITASARDADGRLAGFVRADHRTAALAKALLPIEIVAAEPERAAPGYTLLSVYSFAYLGEGYLFALDGAGVPVWMHRAGIMQAAERLRDGTIAVTTRRGASDAIVLVDAFGTTVAELRAADLGLDSLHHDVVEMPNGNLLALSTEMRRIGGYPGGAVYDVVGDVVVELTRAGEVADSWALLDLLDPHRVGPGFHDPYWITTYGADAKDWSHGNAVGYDPADDGIWVSLRHQDAIVKFRRSDGALLWVVGADAPGTAGDDDWPFLRLVGGGRLPSEQHDPHLLPDGTLWVYDNGNAWGVTRAVRYEIDAAAGTIAQRWAWIDPDYAPPLFAGYVGGVDPLPNGNVLVAHGGLGGSPLDLDNPTWIHVSEVDPRRGDKVLEVRVRGELGYVGYRARRVESLYPTDP